MSTYSCYVEMPILIPAAQSHSARFHLQARDTVEVRRCTLNNNVTIECEGRSIFTHVGYRAEVPVEVVRRVMRQMCDTNRMFIKITDDALRSWPDNRLTEGTSFVHNDEREVWEAGFMSASGWNDATPHTIVSVQQPI